MAPRGQSTAWFWRITATAAACSLVCCVFCLRQTPNVTPVLLRESQQASDLSQAPLVAIGDLHGDLFQAQTALALAGLTDSDGNWRGGSSTLVQTGDLLDRGPDSLALVHLLENLKVRYTALQPAC